MLSLLSNLLPLGGRFCWLLGGLAWLMPAQLRAQDSLDYGRFHSVTEGEEYVERKLAELVRHYDEEKWQRFAAELQDFPTPLGDVSPYSWTGEYDSLRVRGNEGYVDSCVRFNEVLYARVMAIAEARAAGDPARLGRALVAYDPRIGRTVSRQVGLDYDGKIEWYLEIAFDSMGRSVEKAPPDSLAFTKWFGAHPFRTREYLSDVRIRVFSVLSPTDSVKMERCNKVLARERHKNRKRNKRISWQQRYYAIYQKQATRRELRKFIRNQRKHPIRPH